MAYTTGTATDYHDLMDKLRLWLTGTVGWTQLRWTAPASITDTAELWVRGPGAGTDRQVFVGLQSYADAANGYYCWDVAGSTNFDSGLSFALQSKNPSIYFCLWQNSIDYWFYANDRRFIVIAKIGTSYLSMYAGFFLPFALPSEHPFPLYVGATYYIPKAYNYTSSGFRSFADPGDNAAFILRRAGTWVPVGNQENDTSVAYSPSKSRSTGYAMTWPFKVPASWYTTTTQWSWLGNFYNWRPNVNGEVPLFQVHILDSALRDMAGALDGVFAIPAFNRTSEQTVTYSTRTFRLFQNVSRTTGRDFFAVEEN